MTTLMTTSRRSTSLRFTPTAWAKLLFLRDAGKSEIGGFGITAADDLLLVEDFRLVDQECSPLHVAFDDESVAEFFDAEVDAGRQPAQFARVWIHTHPANSAQPSGTDEATFARVFGGSDWALMFILARGGQSYARLCYNVGPGSDVLVPCEIEFEREFDATDFALWQAEYEAHVRLPPPPPPKRQDLRLGHGPEDLDPVTAREGTFGDTPYDWYDDWNEYTCQGFYEEASYGDFRDF